MSKTYVHFDKEGNIVGESKTIGATVSIETYELIERIAAHDEPHLKTKSDVVRMALDQFIEQCRLNGYFD